MKLKTFITISTCFLLIFNVCNAQEIKEKKTLKKAQKFLSEGNYDNAKEEYRKLISNFPEKPLYHFEQGVAYYNSFYQREQALVHFDNALKASSKDTIAEIFFYKGKSNQYIGNYVDAKNNYEIFKSFILENKDGSYVTTQVDRFIQMCNNAIELEANKDESQDVIIKNLGNNVNSKFAEYGSVTKADKSLILYTTRDRENEGKEYYFDSKKHEDIYIAYADDTSWSKRTKIDSSKTFFNSKINTKKHDAVIGFSTNEDKLYIYRSNGIWVSELKDGKYGEPKELEEINTKGHEPSAYLSPDGNTLFFTSNQYDTYGGRDIFVSKKNSEGIWDTPKNLGANINTQYDEDAPFLTQDGKTLFFSSTGHNTIGGYDIFKSEMDENGNWGKAINLGIGFNSGADDIYYTQDTLSEIAYLSSGRAYGYGDMDVYQISLLCKNIPHTEIRGLIVSGDSYSPIKATIKVINASTGEEAGTFTSDPQTGKYLMVLPPDNTYYLNVSTDAFGTFSRPFNDTLILPRQCEFYQMFQHIAINSVKENDKTTAYEAIFDNATFDIKQAVKDKYEITDINEILYSDVNISNDSTYTLSGTIKHNDALSVVNTSVSLINSKGEVIRKSITNNLGSFEFQKLHYSNDYTIAINDEDLKMSYYGNNPNNNEKSIISKGTFLWKNLRADNSIISVEPADSIEVLYRSNDFVISNKTFSDLEGNWILDNLPLNPIKDNRKFPYNFEMLYEDLVYKTFLKDVDTTENPLYTIIRDIIDLPEDAIINTTNSISFEPIYFDFDKFFLRLESKEVLNKIFEYMSKNKDVQIEISGHTDWFGSDDYNMKLSKKRSKSAFDYLKSKGIEDSRLTMKWFGESQPAVSNANPDGSDNVENRQLNRRCEFKIFNNQTAYTFIID